MHLLRSCRIALALCLRAALLSGLVLPVGSARAARLEPLHGSVVHVADGDSFVMRVAGAGGSARRTRVRLTAIDAPEAAQAYHRAAGERLRGLILRRTVRVDAVARDRYGRTVGQVRVDGRDAGLAMLASGLAWYAPAHALDLAAADRQAYRDAERVARQARAGLWALPRPTPPWTFRHAQPTARWAGHGASCGQRCGRAPRAAAGSRT